MGKEAIEIPQPDLRRITVRIKGIPPGLLCSNGKQALDALLDDRSEERGSKKIKRITDPKQAYAASLYVLNGNGMTPLPAEPNGVRYGFPSSGIQKALVFAAVRATDKKGTIISSSIRMLSDLVEIESKAGPKMLTHFVRHGGRTPDLAYRGCFEDWEMGVPLVYNAEVLTEREVITLFSLAGFSIGIGAWRPERSGSFGQFVVEGVERDK